MKKLHSSFTIFSLILFCSVGSAQGMKHTDFLQKAKEYNNEVCPLTSISDENLLKIFSLCYAPNNNKVSELENRIENFFAIRVTCKKLNELLSFEEMERFLKVYTLDDKNILMRKLIYSWDTVKTSCPVTHEPIETSYSRKNKNKISSFAAVLVCAGAHANMRQRNGSNILLLQMAVEDNNVDLVEILLEHGANPNIDFESPVVSIFHVKSRAIAELFVKHGGNIHENKYSNTNVFWYVINNDNYSSDLIEFYLSQNVNARIVDEGHDTLLHELAGAAPSKNIDNYLKKAQLLIAAIPDMINALNTRKKTPIDVAQVFLGLARRDNKRMAIIALGQFIALCQKTAQELIVQKTITH